MNRSAAAVAETSQFAPMRDMPRAVDAERAIIGALLLNNDLFEKTDGILKADFFYDTRHRLMFQAMTDLHAKGHVDPVLLVNRLDDSAGLPDVGGREYVAELADIGAAPVNMAAYVELVRDAALMRKMIQSLNDSLSAAFRAGGKTPLSLLDEAASRLSDVGEVFTREYGGVSEISDLSKAYFQKISDIVRTKNFAALRGRASGFSKLDKLTAGLHGGELIILAGRPGTGKTAFGLNLIRHVSAEANTGVICFSLEMSAEQLVMRMLSHAGVNMHKLRVGEGLTADDLATLARGSSELEERKIHIDDNGMLNILEARARARRLKREMERNGIKLGMIFVDYLQLMDPPPGEKSDSRALEVSTISRGLKALAKELGAPVLAASQLNRSIELRPQKEPMLSDLRESGAIEQDADLILFLHHKDDSDARHADPRNIKVRLTIGKQRNGPVGFVDLLFDRHYSVFREIAHDDGAHDEEGF